MKRLAALVVVAAAGYARHAYLTGYLKGREDCWREIERMDKRYKAGRTFRRQAEGADGHIGRTAPAGEEP